MDEIKARKEAILSYLGNLSITKIIKKFKRSRVWFYKWLNRYRANPKGNWFEERSRRPYSIKKK